MTKQVCVQEMVHISVPCPVLRDPDSNPYSLLEGEGDLADADVGEGVGGDRRRRSRRRRNDQEPSVMDAAVESDSQAGPSENGIGERAVTVGSTARERGSLRSNPQFLFFNC